MVMLTPRVNATSAIHLLSSHDNELVLQFTLPPFDLQAHSVEATDCQQIDIDKWVTTSQPGYPNIPLVGTLIQIPETGEIISQVVAEEYETIFGVELCPIPTPIISKRGDITYSWHPHADIYQNNDWWPTTGLEIGSRQILRGVPVSRLRVFPFQWNPVTKQLRYLKQLTLQIQFTAALSSVNNRTRKKSQAVTDSYATLLQNVLLNYQPPASSASPRSLRSHPRAKPDTETEDRPTQRLINLDDSLRIEISQDGIYRLSYEQLAELGLPVKFINPTRLQLFNQDQEVAIAVNSLQPEQFNPGDFIEFYGQEFNNTFTDTNVYWLYWRNRLPGKRIVPIESSPTPATADKIINTFYNRLYLEEDKQSWLGTPGAPKQDYWFWQRLNATETASFNFELTSVSPTPTEAIIRVGFRGRSTATPHPNHHTVIKLNNTLISDEFWDGNKEFIQATSFSSELLKIGTNQLDIEMPGDTGAIVDVVYPNWIEINFWQILEMNRKTLTFTINGADSSRQIQIDQITQPEVVIYDITSPTEVRKLTNFTVTETESSTYQVHFTTSATEDKTYFIATSNQIESPNQITPWQSNQLKANKNGADYILITANELLPEVEPLVQLRYRQGLRVKAVSVEQIYNEFNAGLAEPKAIKQFLKYAYENWHLPAPTEVLLVGDALLNYKNRKKNQVPTYLSPSWDGLTPSDTWYVTIDGDDNLPDMFIGRIPGGTTEEVAELINKIIRFEESNQPNPRKVLMIADSDQDFEDSHEELISNLLPVNFDVDRVYLRSYLALNQEGMTKEDKIDLATQDIINSMNQGIMVSSYVGHGVVNQWSGSKGLFKNSDLQEVTNEEQLFFAFMLTCINGYFIGNNTALAEAFITAKGGAIGALAPSNLSYLWEDAILAEEAFSILFEQDNRRLGAFTTQAKIAAYGKGTSADVIKTFALFGDPAVTLKAWQ
jgi:hypothetical protein